jgi:translation initiation factor 6 (eIF-6)
VVVKRVDERLSALGNCIACNDHVALTNPDLNKASCSSFPLAPELIQRWTHI